MTNHLSVDVDFGGLGTLLLSLSPLLPIIIIIIIIIILLLLLLLFTNPLIKTPGSISDTFLKICAC